VATESIGLSTYRITQHRASQAPMNKGSKLQIDAREKRIITINPKQDNEVFRGSCYKTTMHQTIKKDNK
jgi:hypothetical protein